MCVLYLMTDGSKAKKSGGRIIIEKDEVKISSVPLLQVESVIISERAQITTQVIFSLLAQGTKIVYVDYSGKVQGVLGGEQISLEHLKYQTVFFQNEENQKILIQYILQEKLKSQYNLLKTYAKTHKEKDLIALAEEIKKYIQQLEQMQSIESLRGLEGMSTRCYFKAFPLLLDQDTWAWQGRNRRPAKDPVNALLNYGYAFLEKEVRIALSGAGLDCRVGFFHSNNGRKDSLVYDLMEIFRHKIIDRFIFRLLHWQLISSSGFSVTEAECRMTGETKKKWLLEYEKYMQCEVKEYQDQTPRKWIRKMIEEFAKNIWQTEKAVV